MILGFMSLLLTVTQDAIIEICIPVRAADTMLPCRKRITNDTAILDSCSAKNVWWNLSNQFMISQMLLSESWMC